MGFLHDIVPPKKEIVIPPGTPLNVRGKPYAKALPSGPRGRWLKKGEHPEGAHLFTKENAAAMAMRRNEKARLAAIEGQRLAAERYIQKVQADPKKAVTIPAAVTDMDAWRVANEKLADTFYNSDSARGVSDLFMTMGKAQGLMDTKGEVQEQSKQFAGLDLEQAQVFLQVNNYYETHKDEIIDIQPLD